jgi:23S rRNA (adenine2503-C2)-methyltransferase
MENSGVASSIIGLHARDLERYVTDLGFPAFHGRQIFSWVYGRQVDGFGLMTDIPSRLRNRLERDFSFDYYRASETRRSRRDGTVKYLFPVDDETGIETVVLPDEESRTSFCISCQIGCPVGCIFCATGSVGFRRNLTAGEIVRQVLTLMKHHGRPDSILFMGMGEPLLNLLEVKNAISLFYEMGLSPRRITVSTCGLIRGLYDLADSGLKPRLAISLGSALEAKRRRMIPMARGSSVQQLKRALMDYREKTRRRITIEYTLLRGLNDTAKDADALVRFAREVRAHVNLIRYNPHPGARKSRRRASGDGSGLAPSAPETVKRIRGTLESRGVPVTERYRRGVDIEAACGQLLYSMHTIMKKQH